MENNSLEIIYLTSLIGSISFGLLCLLTMPECWPTPSSSVMWITATVFYIRLLPFILVFFSWCCSSLSYLLQITNRSFRCASLYLWNQLHSSFHHPHAVHSPPGSPHPVHITSSQSPPSLLLSVTPLAFHSILKTHFFHKSFPP